MGGTLDSKYVGVRGGRKKGIRVFYPKSNWRQLHLYLF